MNTIRHAEDRGHVQLGWLDSHHTFSFGHYHDPAQLGFGALRVINDDIVEPGMGFGTHGHRNMEILSYVLDGALEHKDSMGSGSVLRQGDVQLMSAGTGVEHSEFNHSKSERVHFLQIWIVPKFTGTRPSYQETRYEDADKRGQLRLLASPDGRDGSLTVGQDVGVYATLVDGDEQVTLPLAEGRQGYVHVARGEVTVNGQALKTGDGLKVSAESAIALRDGRDAEVLLFDLAA
ncbi:Pirin [plant metagenome]|uniref:Pirin n=1 Tax=plant metagenome TaxID=1297885 RepID=A0A484UYQ4_9ZZZZ